MSSPLEIARREARQMANVQARLADMAARKEQTHIATQPKCERCGSGGPLHTVAMPGPWWRAFAPRTDVDRMGQACDACTVDARGEGASATSWGGWRGEQAAPDGASRTDRTPQRWGAPHGTARRVSPSTGTSIRAGSERRGWEYGVGR